MILFAHAHNDMKLNLHFCVSKNIICYGKYHYEVISLNRKVQFHCKQKKSLRLFFVYMVDTAGIEPASMHPATTFLHN